MTGATSRTRRAPPELMASSPSRCSSRICIWVLAGICAEIRRRKGLRLNWEIAQDILTEAGFEVDWAEDGQICLDKFQQSEPGYYDAVLMDIRMPVMNGYDAAKALRALDRPDAKLPIIAMTADAFSEDIQQCLECGMNEHVAKPIDIQKLMKLLKTYLK